VARHEDAHGLAQQGLVLAGVGHLEHRQARMWPSPRNIAREQVGCLPGCGAFSVPAYAP